MTLDEAIEKEKRLAVVNCDMATAYHTDNNIYGRSEEICKHKATYHAQIADWLSELKELREQARWTPVDTPPKQSGRYFAQTSYNSMCVLGYAKNLYEVDKFDFCNDKGKSGWYDYESEYGYCKIEDVVAWMPLPKPCDMTADELKMINVDYLRDAIPGDCFHGEVWLKCPYCGKGHELMGCNSDRKDRYLIIKCECGNYFKDRV